jgi:hypothetical protein
MAEWLANTSLPWARYRAIMASRLIALDKCPGVRPIGVGETLRRLLAKCVLAVAGEEAKLACGAEQVCAGMEGGIEAAIHAAKELVAQHQSEEDWDFLLIDARNAFNEGNRTAMLWTVRHE